nr:hypothetical protein [Tanacetum cinerariifolium]
MDMIIDQQVALDEALFPYASRLSNGKSNFHLRSDIMSKESTLQLVYDVLRLTPLYKAFMVTANAPKIYMQKFWATAIVNQHSIRFKMNNKKRIVNLEYFREMLHICPRLPNKTFDELLFEEAILAFLRYLRHSRKIKKITDVNINKLHQPWRSSAAGMYHKKNIDFVYLLWEDFVYQVEHKDAKKSNEMYYSRDDQMFTTIKLVSRHQNTQQFGAILPIKLTNKDIRNYAASKEYYAIASGAAPSKTKASVRKMQSRSDITMLHLTVASTRLSTSAKGKQPAKFSKAEGLSVLFEVVMTEAEQMKLATKRSLQQTHISQASASGADEGTVTKMMVDDQSDAAVDGDDQEDEDEQDNDDQDNNDDDQDTDNDGDDFVHPKLSIYEEEVKDEESFDPIYAEDVDEELYRDVNINLEGREIQMIDVYTTQEFEDTHVTLTSVNPYGQQQSSSVSSKFVTSMLNPSPDVGIDSLFESTPRVVVQASTKVAPLTLTAPTLPTPTIPIMQQVQQAPTPTPTTAPSTFFARAVSSIPKIVERYIDQRMNEAVKIEKTVNEQLEAKVLTRSSNSSKTSYAVATDLSEMELKKILIEKMESNKSIY